MEARGSNTEMKDPCFGACSRHRGQASFFNLAHFIKRDDFLKTSSSSSFSAFPFPSSPAHAGTGLPGLQTDRVSGILSM